MEWGGGIKCEYACMCVYTYIYIYILAHTFEYATYVWSCHSYKALSGIFSIY